MNPGWVYVLVNSAMPGLVKVGKTTRPVADRVNELSGATGVATPFIVAFEQYFLDCDAAEEFVHTELERRGVRESSNREFFRAQTNDIIRVILQAPGLSEVGIISVLDASNNTGRHLEQNEDEFQFRPAWRSVLQQADNAYFGVEDVIQDYQEALELYSDAARLGSIEAYERIGNMYRFGEGVRESDQRAFEYYKEGVKKGNYFCYACMATFYARDSQFENAKKAWAHFFKLRDQRIRGELEGGGNYYPVACCQYIEFFCSNPVHPEFADKLKSEETRIRLEIVKYLSTLVEKGSDLYREPLRWANAHLLDN